MSKRSDGRAFELWTRDLLREWEWSAEAVSMKAMKIQGKLILAGADMFGADVIAMKPREAVKFIQCTLGGGVSKRAGEFRKYRWDFDHSRAELWQKKPDGEVVVQLFNGVELVPVGRIIRRKFYKLEG